MGEGIGENRIPCCHFIGISYHVGDHVDSDATE